MKNPLEILESNSPGFGVAARAIEIIDKSAATQRR